MSVFTPTAPSINPKTNSLHNINTAASRTLSLHNPKLKNSPYKHIIIFKGNLFEQLDKSMKFLLTHIELHGEIGEDFTTRIDKYEIHPEALRETVVNAIIHRDYNMSGSDIKIAVFDSRIEITSPGAMPKGITIEDVVGGRSEIRNKVIVRIFKEAHKIEQWGRGVQRAIRLCVEYGLEAPEIIESGMFVKFTFYRKQDAH